MNADEIVKALRWLEKETEFTYAAENMNGAADLIESLQAQLADYHHMSELVDGKMGENQRLRRINENLQEQLAASQCRELAAAEDLEYACGSSGEFELRSICDICRRKQTDGTCPTQCEMNSLAASNKWQWRGPQDEKGGPK